MPQTSKALGEGRGGHVWKTWMWAKEDAHFPSWSGGTGCEIEKKNNFDSI